MTAVQQFLQPTTVRIQVNSQSFMASIKPSEMVIPPDVPFGTVVALLPEDNTAGYWIGQVIDVKVYKKKEKKYLVRFYNFRGKKWVLGNRKDTGWAPHSSVLVVGIEFNENSSLKKNSYEKIAYALEQDD